MSAIAELDTSLNALLALKAPGVTKSRIAAITTLCVENVKSESTLVQKIFTHFKRAPATHKLGVLYVVDAVSRQWIDKANSSGQDLAANATQDGTFAAGVHKMGELLPAMMNDIVTNAPYDQKDKIMKLIDIWDRGNIFPSSTVSSYKSKLEARKPESSQQSQSTHSTQASTSTPPVQAPQTQPASQPHQPAAVPDLLSNLSNLSGLANNGSPMPNQASTGGQPNMPPQPSTAPSVQTSSASALPAIMQQGGQQMNTDQANQLASIIPANIAHDPVKIQQHLQLLQQLVQLGVPPDQWNTVIAAMQATQQNPQQQPPPQQPPQTQAAMPPQYQQSQHQAYQGAARDRSRSPPRRRASPSYGDYRGNEGGYRQRSPPRGGNSPSMQADMIPLGEPKWTEIDHSLPAGHIKVLSRTLFVGGTQCSEPELRQIFDNYGEVQTCIPNPDKRHAFVKYTTRAASLHARDSLQEIKDPFLQSRIRSVRWGVGFGPRDCNDYATGVSVIPIDRLTDADRKWVLTAPHGGSGGKPIESGLVMEEPDIEIGAGVSSKAISRRMGGAETFRRGRATDAGPGLRGNGRGGYGGGYNRGMDSPGGQQSHAMPMMGYQPSGGSASMGYAMNQYGMPQQPQGFYGLPPGQG